MKIKIGAFLLALCLLLTGCVGQSIVQPEETYYDATFLTLFDTVTTVRGRAESKEAFERIAQGIHDDLERYHRLFDIYNSYEGVNNLKTVNDAAGKQAVKVDAAIIAMLTDCKAYYRLTGGLVNVSMGSVLRLWHEARNHGINDPANAALPSRESLEAAAKHTDWNNVVIDQESSTVYLADSEASLDVGAIAKGWAAQRAAENAPKGLLISVGGNVCATGPKTDSGTPWVIGVQDPNGGDYLHTIYVSGGSVVTSGDYQRAYTVEGKSYHHIIDPQTLMPAAYWRSVTVVCPDSALADALSTALFLLPLEAGKALLETCNAEAMWVDAQGRQHYTPGFEAIIRT